MELPVGLEAVQDAAVRTANCSPSQSKPARHVISGESATPWIFRRINSITCHSTWQQQEQQNRSNFLQPSHLNIPSTRRVSSAQLHGHHRQQKTCSCKITWHTHTCPNISYFKFRGLGKIFMLLQRQVPRGLGRGLSSEHGDEIEDFKFLAS